MIFDFYANLYLYIFEFNNCVFTCHVQVLALLNLYPFEQYIHIETCKNEGEEMLCRPGCRYVQSDSINININGRLLKVVMCWTTPRYLNLVIIKYPRITSLFITNNHVNCSIDQTGLTCNTCIREACQWLDMMLVLAY